MYLQALFKYTNNLADVGLFYIQCIAIYRDGINS